MVRKSLHKEQPRAQEDLHRGLKNTESSFSSCDSCGAIEQAHPVVLFGEDTIHIQCSVCERLIVCALDPAVGYPDCTYQLHIFKIYVLNNSRTINTNACGKLRVLLRFSRQHIFHKVGRNFAARRLPADVLLFFGIE